MTLKEFILKKLEALVSTNQLRSLTHYEKDLLDFSSNDYLGLANESFEFDNLKSGSTGSRLITGNSQLVENLEKDIAAWKKTESALFFGSGYLANIGVISSIAGPRDVIFSDELNHSCILDGIRLSGAKKFFYRNLDVGHLKELLNKYRYKYDNAFVITDTVFSMQGTCADLKSIIGLKEKHDFTLYLDEAHATGTMGETGAGLYASLVEAGELEADQVEIQMGTFSKAAGVEGAYVAGSKELIDYLVNFARTFIYSTASSPYVISMVSQNLTRLISAQEKRKKLNENILYLKSELDTVELDYSNDKSPIFAINLKTNEEALDMSKRLLDNNILVKAIRPPTVPSPCLRICLHASHSKGDIDKIVRLLL